MVAFVGLPAFLILITLASVGLRIFPVSVTRSPEAHGVAVQNAPLQADGAESRVLTPCVPTEQVLEVARRAAGAEFAHEAAPQMYSQGDTCEIVLWRLPKRPGGCRIVTLDATMQVVSVRPGI